jgi:hypothetical protein
VKRAILNGTRWKRIYDAGDLTLVDTNNLSPLPVSWSYDQAAPLGYRRGRSEAHAVLLCYQEGKTDGKLRSQCAALASS